MVRVLVLIAMLFLFVDVLHDEDWFWLIDDSVAVVTVGLTCVEFSSESCLACVELLSDS